MTKKKSAKAGGAPLPNTPWWPRPKQAWPAPRAFDRAAALANVLSSTTSTEQAIQNYDPETKKVTKSMQMWHTPQLSWSELFDGPVLGREEAWFYYSILWKREAVTIEEATANAMPADRLALVRSDLLERSTSEWFDADAYWRIVAGLLSHEELATFIGSGRIFIHKVDGGASIVTGFGDRYRFTEACYASVLPYFGEAEWAIVAGSLEAIVQPSSAWDEEALRLAAVSGRLEKVVRMRIEALDEYESGLLEILFALTDSAFIAAQAKRLEAHLQWAAPLSGYPVSSTLLLRAWLERFGTEELAWVEASIRAMSVQAEANAMCKELGRLARPEIAPVMLGLSLDSKAQKEAKRWLETNAELARTGLADTAKKKDKLGAAARAFLS